MEETPYNFTISEHDFLNICADRLITNTDDNKFFKPYS